MLFLQRSNNLTNHGFKHVLLIWCHLAYVVPRFDPELGFLSVFMHQVSFWVLRFSPSSTHKLTDDSFTLSRPWIWTSVRLASSCATCSCFIPGIPGTGCISIAIQAGIVYKVENWLFVNVCFTGVGTRRALPVLRLIAGSHQAAVTRRRLISLYICCNKHPASIFLPLISRRPLTSFSLLVLSRLVSLSDRLGNRWAPYGNFDTLAVPRGLWVFRHVRSWQKLKQVVWNSRSRSAETRQLYLLISLKTFARRDPSQSRRICRASVYYFVTPSQF